MDKNTPWWWCGRHNDIKKKQEKLWNYFWRNTFEIYYRAYFSQQREIFKEKKLTSIFSIFKIYIITYQMLHVSTNSSVQKNRKIGDWRGDSLVTKKQCKNRNPNGYFTCKSIKIVARRQISKIFICTPLIIILIIVPYFVYGGFLNIHCSNWVSQQWTHYLSILLWKSKHHTPGGL